MWIIFTVMTLSAGRPAGKAALTHTARAEDAPETRPQCHCLEGHVVPADTHLGGLPMPRLRGVRNDRSIVRDLITLPVRLPWLATRLSLRVTGRLATVPLRVAEQLIEAVALAPVRRPGATPNGEVPAIVEVIDVVVAEPLPIREPPLELRRVTPEEGPSAETMVERPSPRPAGAARTRTAARRQVSGEAKARPRARRRRATRARRPTPAAEATPQAAAAAVPEAPVAEAAAHAPAPKPPPPPPPDATPAEPIPPRHVTQEVALVESFADPGAEEGAGATVHVEEPWAGYGQMPAKEIVARLPSASSEELAALELYERAHRSRRTVLAAADRQLRIATAASRRPK